MSCHSAINAGGFRDTIAHLPFWAPNVHTKSNPGENDVKANVFDPKAFMGTVGTAVKRAIALAIIDKAKSGTEGMDAAIKGLPSPWKSTAPALCDPASSLDMQMMLQDYDTFTDSETRKADLMFYRRLFGCKDNETLYGVLEAVDVAKILTAMRAWDMGWVYRDGVEKFDNGWIRDAICRVVSETIDAWVKSTGLDKEMVFKIEYV